MKMIAMLVAPICLIVTGQGSAHADECDIAARFSCHVRLIESVQIRLDGSAAELGFDKNRIARSVRDRLQERVPDKVKVQMEPAAFPDANEPPPNQRGRFVCTLWTVGDYFTISMFVECGLEAVEGDWEVESRLLGHIRQDDLQESVDVALAMVIGKVVERLQHKEDAPRSRSVQSDRKSMK